MTVATRWPIDIKARWNTRGTLWSAREIASMALSTEQARHTENVFHIALRRGETHVEHYGVQERESFSGALGGARETH